MTACKHIYDVMYEEAALFLGLAGTQPPQFPAMPACYAAQQSSSYGDVNGPM